MSAQIALRIARCNLLGDCPGIKSLDDGDWQTRKHAVQGRWQWRQVHLVIDPATSDVRAVEFTPSCDVDSLIGPDLLGQFSRAKQIGKVSLDGS